MLVKEALEELEEIGRMIDEDVKETAYAKGEDFFVSIKESVGEVEETIKESDRVTTSQASAIRGWKKGVGGWIHDD